MAPKLWLFVQFYDHHNQIHAESDYSPKSIKIMLFLLGVCRIILHRRWFWPLVTVSLWIGGRLVFLCPSVVLGVLSWTFGDEWMVLCRKMCWPIYLHIGQTPWLIIWNEHSKQEKNARTNRILLEFWALSSNFGIQIKPWSIHLFWQVRTHVGQATLRILQPDADLCANTQRIEEGRPVAIHAVMSLSCLNVS